MIIKQTNANYYSPLSEKNQPSTERETSYYVGFFGQREYISAKGSPLETHQRQRENSYYPTTRNQLIEHLPDKLTKQRGAESITQQKKRARRRETDRPGSVRRCRSAARRCRRAFPSPRRPTACPAPRPPGSATPAAPARPPTPGPWPRMPPPSAPGASAAPPRMAPVASRRRRGGRRGRRRRRRRGPGTEGRMAWRRRWREIEERMAAGGGPSPPAAGFGGDGRGCARSLSSLFDSPVARSDGSDVSEMIFFNCVFQIFKNSFWSSFGGK